MQNTKKIGEEMSIYVAELNRLSDKRINLFFKQRELWAEAENIDKDMAKIGKEIRKTINKLLKLLNENKYEKTNSKN